MLRYDPIAAVVRECAVVQWTTVNSVIGVLARPNPDSGLCSLDSRFCDSKGAGGSRLPRPPPRSPGTDSTASTCAWPYGGKFDWLRPTRRAPAERACLHKILGRYVGRNRTLVRNHLARVPRHRPPALGSRSIGPSYDAIGGMLEASAKSRERHTNAPPLCPGYPQSAGSGGNTRLPS
jgi:hypothetical protein